MTDVKSALDVARLYGAALEADLRWKGSLYPGGIDHFYASAAQRRVTHYYRLDPEDEAPATWFGHWRRWIHQHGPVLVVVGVDAAFAAGPELLDAFDIESASFNHAAALVGYGPGGFLVRCSWGSRGATAGMPWRPRHTSRRRAWRRTGWWCRGAVLGLPWRASGGRRDAGEGRRSPPGGRHAAASDPAAPRRPRGRRSRHTPATDRRHPEIPRQAQRAAAQLLGVTPRRARLEPVHQRRQLPRPARPSAPPARPPARTAPPPRRAGPPPPRARRAGGRPGRRRPTRRP